jgi:hypothetical protein
VALGRGFQSAKRAVSRRRGVARGALPWVEAAAAIATVAVITIGLINHFFPGGEAIFPGEGKRVVAFRQITNRICTEHRGNLRRALAQAPNRVVRLGYVARAIGWDLNDLESITPPPTKFDAFLAELATRRQTRAEVLALQRAIELEDEGGEAKAIATLERLDDESRELSRESGVIRCTAILPPIPELTRR